MPFQLMSLLDQNVLPLCLCREVMLMPSGIVSSVYQRGDVSTPRR